MCSHKSLNARQRYVEEPPPFITEALLVAAVLGYIIRHIERKNCFWLLDTLDFVFSQLNPTLCLIVMRFRL
jgi:hypothetical protein